MIPKIIHYCWFGGKPLPPIAKKSIKSWKKYCPDFEIKEWNENNFDVNTFSYSKQAAATENPAFVADIARLYVIYNYGGIYLDIDVEVIKPLDNFLKDNMFTGFENENEINMGSGFGAEKNFYLIGKMLDFYDNIPFINEDNTFNTTSSPAYTTISMKQEGFLINNTKQIINNATLYPTEFFSPKDWRNGEIHLTENTHTIHHYLASWWNNERKKEHSKYKRQYQINKQRNKVKQKILKLLKLIQKDLEI